MKNKIIILAVLALSTACGSAKVNHHTDPELQPFADAFVAQAKERGIEVEAVPMIFEEGLEKIAGRCHFDADGNHHVGVNREYWEKLNSPEYQAYKLSIVMHEQGHCVFDLDHVDGSEIMGKSLAYPTPTKVEKYWHSVKGLE